MRKLSAILHTIIFTLYPIIFLYAHNIKEVFLSDIIAPLSAVLICTALFFAAIYFVLFKRNIEKSGIATTLFVILFFTYGRMFYFMRPHFARWGLGSFIELALALMIIFWAVILLTFFKLYRSEKSLDKPAKILNVVGVALMIFVFFNIFSYKEPGTDRRSADKLISREFQEADSDRISSQSPLPDIYYIILDCYGNDEILDKVYDYDNSGFTDYLKSKGFFVSDQSFCNYNKTTLSLLSSLNFQYINFDNVSNFDGSHIKMLIPYVTDNRTCLFLKSLGYELIHFGSWYELTRKNKNADLNINREAYSEFTILLLKSTMLYPVGAFFELSWYFRKDQWLRVRYKLEKFREIIERPGPKFIFAHFIVPHTPFIFDQDGSYKPPGKQVNTSTRDNYIDQLIYINSQIKTVIDAILAKSETPPIIILQADEGPNRNRGREIDFTFTDSLLAFRAESMILNAYHLPGVLANSVLYEGITPVNTFRVVFNEYFGTSYELLEDRSYDIYFNENTDLIRTGE